MSRALVFFSRTCMHLATQSGVLGTPADDQEGPPKLEAEERSVLEGACRSFLPLPALLLLIYPIHLG